MVYRNNPITPGNIRLGWVLASRIARVRLDGPARREAMSLDPQGKAIADVHGLALTSDETRLVVSACGTHELLVYRTDGLPLKDYGGTDHIEPELLKDSERFHRIELGGRPMGLRIGQRRQHGLCRQLPRQQRASRRSGRTRSSPARSRSAARQNPRSPAKAKRSSTTPAAASTSGTAATPATTKAARNSVPIDTINDGTAFTFKTVLPLYNLPETGPWTWHGWQTDLRAGMKKVAHRDDARPAADRAKTSTRCSPISRQLEPPPNPFRDSGRLAQRQRPSAARRSSRAIRPAAPRATAARTSPTARFTTSASARAATATRATTRRRSAASISG